MSSPRKDESLAPIWARPEPRGRSHQAVLSRAQIVTAALRLADEEGLEAVTMRRLGRELRAGAMSLYHYFESRDELLILMGDTVAAELLVPAPVPTDWRVALKAIATQGRAAFKRHPWLLLTLQERPLVTPNLLRHIEQSSQAVAALGAQGVDRTLLGTIVMAVDDYLVGYTLRELQAADPEARARGTARRFSAEADEPHIRYLLDSGEFPMLAAFAAEGGQEVALGDRFEQGLDWLLDGFAAQLGR